ncbi:tryptophan halogenase family protein [Teredinibacter turnerae]|uniref:tryptophan halogenase family protein n=1 Tax=Teredinibacter turnerae TaxID=2426 RepID=UPI000421356B|nr:tryptophan halogenase family protein [Teredinibacter turnerae]
MTNNRIEKIVIVGGGTAGWMTAAACGKLLKTSCEVELVESEALPPIGVGEATIPQINLFNKVLQLDEDDFVRKTQATFKLGIEFVNWTKLNHRYLHPFGSFGRDMEGVEFHHFWLKMCKNGSEKNIEDYSLAAVAAKKGRFTRPINIPNSPLAEIHYAFHFDAGLYAKYLRDFSEARGVIRTEGRVKQVIQHPDSGFIESLTLDDGRCVKGDLFIDCTGFQGLLIEQTLKTGYVDWREWLPCDTAIAVPCTSNGDPTPYTRSTAHTAGWQWRIPLQHRIGNGHVFSSRFMSSDEATSILLNNLDGEPLAEPREIKFNGGKRKRYWNKNVVAIGLSSGFVEPLESTAIHLIQSTIARLFSLFPTREFRQEEIDRFNRLSDLEMDRVRDFIILHYIATERDDSPFWQYIQEMEIPEYLQNKIRMYQNSGRIYREDEELFNETSWLAVLHGQGIRPTDYHPVVDTLSLEEVRRRVDNIEAVIKRSSEEMPSHAEFIATHCKAQPMGKM